MCGRLHFTPVAPEGAIGVDLFFVLSGFLITTILLEGVRSTGSLDLVAFYWRRFFRLAPALLVFLAIIAPAQQLVQGWDRPFVSTALALTYSGNFASAGVLLPDIGAPYQHTWTLAMEEQFYLIWPVLLMALTRWCASWLARICIGLTFFTVLFFPVAVRAFGEGAAYFLPTGHVFYLTAGTAIASLRARR